MIAMYLTEHPAALSTEPCWNVPLLYAPSTPWAFHAARCSFSNNNNTTLLRVLSYATSAATNQHGNIYSEH